MSRIVPVGFQPKHRRAVDLIVSWNGKKKYLQSTTRVFHCKTGKLLYVGPALAAQTWCWKNGFPIVSI